MKIEQTELDGAFIITPDVFGDSRGWFMETYTKSKLTEITNIEFVQDNQSYSAEKGILRGLHCQTNPHSQTKLIRCTRGKIADVIVDIRVGSPTYKKWIKVELSEENKKQLFIPKGFLHGFVTLTVDAEVQYKVDDYYSKECDRSIKFDDPELGVEWGIENPVLSEKDKNACSFSEKDFEFEYKRG